METKNEQDELLIETQLTSEMIQAAIREISTVALDQTEYDKRSDSLSAKFFIAVLFIFHFVCTVTNIKYAVPIH